MSCLRAHSSWLIQATLWVGMIALGGCGTPEQSATTRSMAEGDVPVVTSRNQPSGTATPEAAKPSRQTKPAWNQVILDDAQARPIAIHLGAPRQTFVGFGTSFLHCNRWMETTPLAVHRELAQQTWGPDGLQIMRTWLYLPETLPSEGRVDVADYVKRYVSSQLITEARTAGCRSLTVVPAQFPPWMRLATPEAVVPVINGHEEKRVVSDANMEVMMDGIAEAIRLLRDEHDISVTATGIQNEPNSDHGDSGYITIAQTPLAVKALRRALNLRGLHAVAIIAPETSSVDWAFTDRIAALRADDEAWAALSGVAWHSYNMAMVPSDAEALRASGKELWMTEASANGAEPSNDRYAAATMVARIANDLRYGASRWIWFLGYEGHDPKDDQTRLMRIYQDRQLVTYEVLGKFYVLKDICAAFPPGSTILATESPALAAWTYGRKPVVQAVAATRPDGAIALATVNFTSADFPVPGSKGSFEIENAGLPAEVQRQTWTLPIQEGMAQVRRRADDLSLAVEEVLPVHDGSLTLIVRPLEIVTVVVTPLTTSP